MRKGRSSRRSRVSRPLIGVKSPISADALSTDTPSVAPPRVVVGIQPSEPPPEVAETKSEAKNVDPLTALERLEKVSVPPLKDTLVDVARPDIAEERKRDFASTMVQGSAFASLGSDLSPPPPSTAVPAVQPVKVAEAPLPAPKPVVLEKVEAPRAPKLEPYTKTASSSKILAAEPAEDPDEISVPPIGDVAVEQFFSEGDLSRHITADGIEGDALTIPDKAKRKSEPEVVLRRERFSRYVRWAVAGAAIVCLAAAFRTALMPKGHVAATATVVEAPPEPKAAEQAVAPLAEPAKPAAAPPAPEGANAPAATPTVADPAPAALAPSNDPVAATTAAAAGTEAKTEEVTGDPKEEKAKARSMLEKRKLAEAIEAGEKSVHLDPTDGEAWLILGASYQEKGNLAEARRAYGSCVKEAKTGPRAECAKMLH